MRRFFAFFILAAVLCGLTSGHAGASSPAPVVTDNAGDHNYEGNTARPVRSYLMAGNGSFMTRVEYTGDRITVESYNETGQILSQQDLAVELPLFGGFTLETSTISSSLARKTRRKTMAGKSSGWSVIPRTGGGWMTPV